MTTRVFALVLVLAGVAGAVAGVFLGAVLTAADQRVRAMVETDRVEWEGADE